MTVKKVADLVRSDLVGDGSSHDWLHIERVWKLAERIAKKEGADVEIVEIAALLHDIGDWKFHGGDELAGGVLASKIMTGLGFPSVKIDHVVAIVNGVSFKGAGVPTPMDTIEGKCVQDADRLDALGAIGIARCFAYSGHAGRALYSPLTRNVSMHGTFEEYKKSNSTALDHFHEKLYLLRDRMNTSYGRELAEERHNFMKDFENRMLMEIYRFA
jgi:uncharacterized protein